MIKAKQFKDKYKDGEFFSGPRKTKDAYKESLKFANKIEKEGNELINIAVVFNVGEFEYIVYYRGRPTK